VKRTTPLPAGKKNRKEKSEPGQERGKKKKKRSNFTPGTRKKKKALLGAKKGTALPHRQKA